MDLYELSLMKSRLISKNNLMSHENKNAFSLSATSALVLLWARGFHYAHPKTQLYLDKLKLNEGRYLYEHIQNTIWPHYSEIIHNRKFGILKYCEKYLAKNRNESVQIIIAGAGFDPLGLDLISRYPNVQVYEIDREGMTIKAEIINSLPREPESTNELKLITADLNEITTIHQQLLDVGWTETKKTLLLFQGISYYLSSEILKALIFQINPTTLLIEYLNWEQIRLPEYRNIARSVFSTIAKSCKGVGEIQTYNPNTLETLLNPYTVTKHWTLKQLEYDRTQKNHFFKEENDGWIEIVSMKQIEPTRDSSNLADL